MDFHHRTISDCSRISVENRAITLVDRSYGTQRAGSFGSSGSLWEDAHIASRYQPVPTNPKIALITLSATERPSNIDQAKSANAHNENTSTTPLLLKLRPRCCFVSFMSKDYAPSQLAKTAFTLKTPSAFQNQVFLESSRRVRKGVEKSTGCAASVGGGFLEDSASLRQRCYHERYFQADDDSKKVG